MEAVTLAPFRPARSAIPPLSERLTGLGVALRPASGADLNFLRQLHADMRAAELILAPWSPAEKAAFCESQFTLQHQHYARLFRHADYWVVTQGAKDIGRLTVERKRKTWRIVDIIMSVQSRGSGIGAALVEWVQACAAAAKAESVALSVTVNNPGAQALYRRLGFRESRGTDPVHIAMEWRPDAG